MTALQLIQDRLLDQQRNNGSEETIRVLNELREAVETLYEPIRFDYIDRKFVARPLPRINPDWAARPAFGAY